MVIADFGSGNTCKNNPDTILAMIRGLDSADRRHDAIIKWQLFAAETVPLCTRLTHEAFDHAYNAARMYGYQTTASVFDVESLELLLSYDVPFVKIAAREWAYPLISKVPRGVPVVVSVVCMNDAIKYMMRENMHVMCCVPEYPAPAHRYGEQFSEPMLHKGISDHSPSLNMWRKYRPEVYERHFKLPDSTGLDAGPFASTPEEWKEILA
jgi:sialic acid synthase SpsE